MSRELSRNTQAILLLTAPLIAGRERSSAKPLTPGEYKRLVRRLMELEQEPADLLGSAAANLIEQCRSDLDAARIDYLLGRGFQLSQAVDHWYTRALWVMSRADPGYPQRFKTHLGEDAPSILYGCGDSTMLDSGGLAVVGSRDVNDELMMYTQDVGRLAADAGRAIVSGGARGIDQAAMRGALEQGGQTIGVLANGLEKAAMNRDHREALMDKHLVLISPYDPSVRFLVGYAMQRNKLIYALADAALVVNTDHGKGGTWTGAVEQLEKLRFVPIYTRSTGTLGKGLEALLEKGAKPWPNPSDTHELDQLLDVPFSHEDARSEQTPLSDAPSGQQGLPFTEDQPDRVSDAPATPIAANAESDPLNPAEALFEEVSKLLDQVGSPTTEVEVADYLAVSKSQARAWLQRLVEAGAFEKLTRPVRYRRTSSTRD